ncbi:MAG: Flp pilus assembly complex ATPase component TadA [Candidatus Pacebacteria bacterium]|nr:Flp pilus assembly complex ATPase component TadA [Candidatus Paceibacterota bacterium]
MRVEPQQLKLFLLDANLVTQKQFEQVQKKAKQKNKEISEILIDDKLISQEELIKLKAYILGIPFVNLEEISVDPEVLKIIPEPIAKTNNIIAFRKKGKELEVAMLDPEDLRMIEFIKKKADLKILARLTTPKGIKNALLQYAKTLEAEFGALIDKDAQKIKTIKNNGKIDDKKDLENLAEELPVIRIVELLLKHAILQRASDIHIEPSEKEVIVRYRIDGILRDVRTLPKQVSLGIVARIKVLSNLQLDEHRLAQDGRFKIEQEEYKYSVRVSILPVFHGEKIVMRLLSESAKVFTLEQLGLRESALEKVQDNLRKPVGLILVTGPTGCGKTTTLYSMMEILNTPEVNISTVEDPIEYRMPRINQTQVRPKIGFTFAAGLRALVRQDPDIIMVGEIRDNETAGLAINAALTGHLVLSTLHTTDASGAISRLIDMQVEPFLISSTLSLVLAQRLVRKLYDQGEKYFLTKSQIKEINKYCDLERILQILKDKKIAKPKDTLENVSFFKPKSSKDCDDGYSGRIGIYEVLVITEEIKEMIVKGDTDDKIQKQAQKQGMLTMVEDGFIKAAQGMTSIEEVLRVIIE